MLIQTPPKQGDVITVRTSAGEEIVARYVEETDMQLTVEKPMAVVASGQGFGLMPMAFTIPQDANVKLSLHSILFHTKTEDDMARQYLQSSSGISL